MLDEAAREELVLFQETSDEYFRDPEATLAAGDRDEAVGFGLDVAMLTPYVLAIVTPVIHFLASSVAEAVGEEAKRSVAALVRGSFREPPTSRASQRRRR